MGTRLDESIIHYFTGNCVCFENTWGRNILYCGKVDFHLLMQILHDLKGNLVDVHRNSQHIAPNLLFRFTFMFQIFACFTVWSFRNNIYHFASIVKANIRNFLFRDPTPRIPRAINANPNVHFFFDKSVSGSTSDALFLKYIIWLQSPLSLYFLLQPLQQRHIRLSCNVTTTF